MMRRNPDRSRHGLTAVAVLVCLLVITILGAALLKLTLVERQKNRDLERRLQAEWLVESGVARGLARLAENPGYAGETWQITASELGLPESSEATAGLAGDRAGALVTIRVDRDGEKKGRLRLRVQADYPRDGSRPSRLSQERIIDLEPKKPGATP
jgi:hypothetical protein